MNADQATDDDHGELLRRMLFSVESLEEDFELDVEDARRHGVVTSRLRDAIEGYCELFERDPPAGAPAALRQLFYRVFKLVVFEGKSAPGDVANDALVQGVLAGNSFAGTHVESSAVEQAKKMSLDDIDLFAVADATLMRCLKPWAARVERKVDVVTASISREIAGGTAQSAQISIRIESAKAWTCALRLVAHNECAGATFKVRQRRGMRALMRRKVEGKSGSTWVKAVFSVDSNERGDALLDSLAPIFMGLEFDDVSASVGEKIEIELPFISATPSEMERGARALAAAWQAIARVAQGG